jgi:hypothetical protein
MYKNRRQVSNRRRGFARLGKWAAIVAAVAFTAHFVKDGKRKAYRWAIGD